MVQNAAYQIAQKRNPKRTYCVNTFDLKYNISCATKLYEGRGRGAPDDTHL